jgi:hypothetical protein
VGRLRTSFISALVARLHQIVLRVHDDLPGKVIQGEEEARHGEAEQTRDTEEFVEKDASHDDLDRRV